MKIKDLSFLDPEFNRVPIGQRAELLDDLDQINNFSGHIIGPLKIKKNFTWGHNTKPKVSSYISGLRWSKKRGDMQQFFNHDKRIRSFYNERRYKSKIIELDNKLKNLRYSGALWNDDPEEIPTLIKAAKERYINSIESLCLIYELNSIFSNEKREFNIDNDSRGIINNSLESYLKRLSDKDEQTNEFHIVNLQDDQQICFIFDIKSDMDIYSNTSPLPMDSFSAGKIIVLIRYTYSALAKTLLGLVPSGNQCIINVFYQNELRDPFLRHPFISQDANIYKIDRKHRSFSFGTSSGYYVCFGDFSIATHVNRFRLERLMHDLRTWASTFRIGITNPINRLPYSWYGLMPNPSNELKKREAAFYPSSCKTLMKMSIEGIPSIYHNNSRIARADAQDLIKKTRKEFDLICATCEKRCLKNNSKHGSLYECSSHPGYKERKEAQRAKEKEESQSPEAIAEIEQTMREWAQSNQ